MNIEEPNRAAVREAVNEIEHMLARLKSRMQGGSVGGPPEIDLQVVAQRLYAERRLRDRTFPPGLFGEPAWDLMLDLYIHQRWNRRVSISSACIGAHVPNSTGLRWIMNLEQRGLIERHDDDEDRRRQNVVLTDAAIGMIESYLRSLGAPKG